MRNQKRWPRAKSQPALSASSLDTPKTKQGLTNYSALATPSAPYSSARNIDSCLPMTASASGVSGSDSSFGACRGQSCASCRPRAYRAVAAFVGSRTPDRDRIQTVAHAADGLEVGRPGAVGFNFLPYPANARVHAARSHELHVAPDRVQQQIAGEHLSPMLGKIFDEAKFQARGRHFLAPYREPHRRAVNDKVRRFRSGERSLREKTPQHGLHAGNEFPWAKWLDDAVVSTRLQRQNAVFLGCVFEQKQQRSPE